MAVTAKTRVFVSFDYDNDDDVRKMLLGQAKNRDTLFSFEDWSIKQETKGWKEDARKRIRRCEAVIVICGLQTHHAVGVAQEVEIARDEDVPFHLLRGRKIGTCRRPQGTSWMWDTMHDWTWKDIASMCGHPPEPWWKKYW
jgi:hypothetical protein